MFEKILLWHLKHSWVGLLLALLLAALGISQGVSLPIRLSLADLLPETRESVLDLQAVSKEVGGVGYLIILLGPMEHPDKVLKKTAESLKSDPDIRYSYFEREAYSLRDKALYLMSEREFDDVMSSGRIVANNGKSGLIDLGLETEKEQRRNLRIARSKLRKFAQKGSGERYFLSEDKKYAMVLAKPVFDSEDLGKSKILVDRVEQNLREVLGKDAPFHLVGRYVDKVNDTKQIERDIEFTSLLSLLGVAFVLIFGLGTLKGAILTVLAVTVAMAWTLGAAHLMVGQINILTGFLLAILGGMGVEYGVHLIRRMHQEVASGLTHKKATERAYLQTGRALGSAAITSSAAFLILTFSDFRGFSELGRIAGFGILSIYFVYMLMFPALSRFMRAEPRFSWAKRLFGFFPAKRRWRWIVPPFVMLCLWGVWNAEFEYNFKRMHNLSEDTRKRNDFVGELFGRSFTPAALLAKDAKQALEVEKWLNEAIRKDVIQEGVSGYRLLPSDMDERYEEMERMASRLEKISDQDLSARSGMNPQDIRDLVAAKPYGRKNLPPQLQDAFGKSGNVVLAYPAKDLDQAVSMREFSNILVEARQEFPGLKIGSDVRIFSEILDHITHDGIIILLVFLAGAFVVMGLDFRNVIDSVDLVLQLLMGIFLLVAFMGLVGERFSILNIAMVPAVLAAGIDMGVHVRHREREGFGALPSARFVAQAVHLSMLTTIAGFGSLFFAEAGMLKGIAWISVLGQLSMYVVCMILWPVYRGERIRRISPQELS
ncbi:MAG: MMPL family transporter [Oligoflexia bacterium]|nr:MMPL family transporter [Oligoflexia bacterium]